MMSTNLKFRRAEISDREEVWEILQQGILRRKLEGSSQWQDGYPNLQTIDNDIENGFGVVFCVEEKIAAYAAFIFENEPAYEVIEGKWLSDYSYLVIHRVAVSKCFLGKGLATEIFKNAENIAETKNYFSIRVDTNFDNHAMLKILKKLKYSYCGEVYFRGFARRAFEKLLN
jgi:GNAT superfamily N-acetyltransferase